MKAFCFIVAVALLSQARATIIPGIGLPDLNLVQPYFNAALGALIPYSPVPIIPKAILNIERQSISLDGIDFKVTFSASVNINGAPLDTTCWVFVKIGFTQLGYAKGLGCANLFSFTETVQLPIGLGR